jgi:hypothetical protein
MKNGRIIKTTISTVEDDTIEISTGDVFYLI